jgi:tRNA-dihydrouridine synthase B
MGFANLSALQIGPYAIEPPVIMAPMAAVSESPYRKIALEFGAGLAPTELVSSKGLEYANSRTEDYLRHDPESEQPFTVQLFGGDPDSMASASEAVVKRGAKIIDINMGCPVKKVTRTGAGSALMCDPDRTVDIVRAMIERVGPSVPVMAKIRAGWAEDSINAPSFGRRLEDAGVSAIAIHARTRMQAYAGRADWDLIRRLVEAVELPVIANGDIFTVEDAEQVVNQTGCAAVMIGRAALGNPWVFRALRAAHRGEAVASNPTPTERASLIARHFGSHCAHHRDELRAIRRFRQHLIWYSRGLRGASDFRQRAMKIDEKDVVIELIHSYFCAATVASRDAPMEYDERRALG